MSQPPPTDEDAGRVDRSRYRELVAPHRLRQEVVCFWRHPVGPAGGVARVVPDGCVDLIWIDDRPPVIAGPATLPTVHPLAAGTTFLGVRFRPGTAHRLFGISARHLRNQEVPLRDVWPGRRCLAWEAPTHAQTLSAKLCAIDAVIHDQLATTDAEPFIARAATWIARHPGRPVAELAHLSGLSPRQIHRRFEETVGYGPKTLQRIMRLQRLLWLATQSREPSASLVGLSLAAGYADQSHMTREVMTLTGLSPRQLLRGTAVSCTMSDLFKTTQDAHDSMGLLDG